MKNLLTKLFPEHSTGTAGTILFFLLGAILMSGITYHDYLGQGADDYELAMIGLFVLLAGGIYFFGKKNQRVGK